MEFDFEIWHLIIMVPIYFLLVYFGHKLNNYAHNRKYRK